MVGAGPLSISVVSVLLDGERAAVELNSKGVTKAGAALDEQSLWLVKIEGGLITEGEFADSNSLFPLTCGPELIRKRPLASLVTSYIDSAALEKLLAEATACLGAIRLSLRFTHIIEHTHSSHSFHVIIPNTHTPHTQRFAQAPMSTVRRANIP